MQKYIEMTYYLIFIPNNVYIQGFIPPTGGTARVNGYDIREDISSVRSSLGLCPQHDVLFDTMTVEEHLIFFGKVYCHLHAKMIYVPLI